MHGARDRDSRTLVRAAVVKAVDVRKRTCTVQFVNTEALEEGVKFANPYWSGRGVGWMGSIPCEDDMVLVGSTPEDGSYRILAYDGYSHVESDNPTGETLGGERGARDNFKGQRPAADQGDLGMWGAGGGGVIVRQNGNIEQHADPLCKTTHFGKQGVIRSLAGTYIREGGFGVEELFTRRSVLADKARRTPTGYKLHLKSLAQASPHVFLEAGAVEGQERDALPGYPSLDTYKFGNGVCFRLAIHSPDEATTQAKAGLYPPDARRAKLSWRADSAGNFHWTQKGQLTQSLKDRVTHISGRDITQVEAQETRSEGNLTWSAEGVTSLNSRGPMILSSGSSLTLRARRLDLQADGQQIRFKGSWEVEAGGNASIKTQGHLTFKAAGQTNFSTSQSRSDTVGGVFHTTVLGSVSPENATHEVVSSLHKVSSGGYAVQVQSGSVEISVGPSAAPVASIRIHQDPRDPGRIGQIDLTTPLGASLTVRPDGSFQLGSERAAVSCDPAGVIQLGPSIGATAGYVVTTDSHRDYITGLPLGGNPLVKVSTAIPPVPLPGVVSPPMVPGPERIPLPSPPDLL